MSGTFLLRLVSVMHRSLYVTVCTMLCVDLNFLLKKKNYREPFSIQQATANDPSRHCEVIKNHQRWLMNAMQTRDFITAWWWVDSGTTMWNATPGLDGKIKADDKPPHVVDWTKDRVQQGTLWGVIGFGCGLWKKGQVPLWSFSAHGQGKINDKLLLA